MFKLREASSAVPSYDPGDDFTPAEWTEIPIGAFVKYQKIDGQIVRGGYLVSRSIEKKTLYFQSGDISWNVNIANVKKLWQKKSQSPDISFSENVLAPSVKFMPDPGTDIKLEELTIRMEKMELRVKNIENDLKKLIMVLSRGS